MGGKIVNIDPDFFGYTPNVKIIDCIDWGNFRKIHGEKHRLNKEDVRYFGRIRKSAIEKTQDAMGKLTLIDHLPIDLQRASVLKSVSVDNLNDY